MSITDKLDKLVEIYQQAKVIDDICINEGCEDGFNICMFYTRLGVQL